MKKPQEQLSRLDDREAELCLLFLKDFRSCEFALNKLTGAQKLNIQKLIMQPEWSSLHELYNNIIYKFYKNILEDDDVKTAKRIIMFLSYLQKLPLTYKNHAYERNVSNEGSKIVEPGYYTKDEVGTDVPGVNERHGEVLS